MNNKSQNCASLSHSVIFLKVAPLLSDCLYSLNCMSDQIPLRMHSKCPFFTEKLPVKCLGYSTIKSYKNTCTVLTTTITFSEHPQ